MHEVVFSKPLMQYYYETTEENEARKRSMAVIEQIVISLKLTQLKS